MKWLSCHLFSSLQTRILTSILLIFLASHLHPSPSLAKQQALPVYRVGIDREFEPYEYVETNGDVAGFTPALLHAIGAEAGVRFELVPLTWPEVVKALESGQIDLASMIYSPERADHFLFSKPHSQISQGIFRHHKSKNISDLASLTGHSVGLQERDIALTLLEDRSDFRKQIFTSKLEGLLHLNQGKTDAFICSQQPGIHLISEYHLTNISLAAGNLFPQQYAFASHKGQEKLVEMLNQHLNGLKNSGTLQTLTDTWLTGHLPRTSWIEQNKMMLGTISATAIAILLLLTLWACVLKKQIRSRTEELRVSEEKFRQMAEKIPEVFWMTTIDRSSFLYVSPAYATVWGRSVESLYASPLDWLEAIHPDDRPRIRQRATTELSSGSYTEKYRIIKPDGTVRWIAEQAFPIRDNTGTIYRIAGLSQDITREKERNAALQSSRQQLETIIEAIPDVVFLKDGQGRWQVVNKAAQRLFCVEDLPWHNKSELDLIPLLPDLESTLRLCKESDERAWLAKQPSRSEERISRPDGGTACYDVVKIPIFDEESERRQSLVVVGRDITERQQMELDLAEQEIELATIFENIPLIMLLVDQDRKIRRANKIATDFTGLSTTDMLGKPPGVALSCIHAHDVPEGCGAGPFCQQCQVRRLLMESISTRASHVQQEIKHQFIISGKVRDLTLFLSTVPVTVRHEPMVLVAMQDVSDYKSLEDQLQQAQRMESIGTLAGGIAHDFNNILSAIIGFTDLALMDTEKGSTVEGDLQQVRQAANRATALVRQILTFSRRERHEKLALQISLVVKEALKLLRASIPSTIAIKQEIATEATVFADSTQIHQLIMNLCTNAYQAMLASGGELRVSLQEMTLIEPSVENNVPLPPGHYVMLTVSDTGCGMDKHTLQRIYEPYFTTKEQGKGTGLGLAVVHGIVKSHQGHITVSTEQNRGTIFTVYLPVLEQNGMMLEITEQALPISTHHERIMVVDDEESIRDINSQFLAQAGYQVDQFATGDEAWQALSSAPNNWQLILTDQTMPGTTGLQMAAKAKEIRPDLPIILNSGYLEVLNDLQIQETETFTILIKPVERHKLLFKVREMLDAARTY